MRSIKYSDMIEKTIFSVSLCVTFLFVFMFFYTQVFEPAYVSYVHVCDPTTYNLSFSGMYVSAGSTTGVKNLTNGQVDISVHIEEEYKENNEVLKHENCHKHQFKRDTLNLGCSTPILHYFSEVECYLADELPNEIYLKIYGNYK